MDEASIQPHGLDHLQLKGFHGVKSLQSLNGPNLILWLSGRETIFLGQAQYKKRIKPWIKPIQPEYLFMTHNWKNFMGWSHLVIIQP